MESVILGHAVRAFAIAVIVFVGTAHAAPKARAAPSDGIVLESYTGKRPDDANRLLAPVLDELASRKYVAGAEVVGRRFEQRVSRPSTIDGGLSAETFGEQVERGHKAWIAGRFDEAIKVLTPIADSAHANPGAFAQNQPLRDKLLKALIALALSHQRTGDQDATRATFGEILRSFPDTTLSRASYGPEAFNLFEEVKKQLTASGRGKLIVKVVQDGAVVFVNERFQAVGSTRTDLLPGEYRVFAQAGRNLSRVHRVKVTANEEATVTLDAEFDALVHTSPKWTGFQFADAVSRDKLESVYAAAFANAIDARGVVVLGIDEVKGRPAVVGSLVDLMSGREVRRASLPLDPDPSVAKLRALGRFIAGDNAAPGIDIQLAGDVAPPTGGDGGVQIGDRRPRGDGGEGGMWGGWKYVTGGLALGALGAGAYLLSIDGDCTDDPCTYQRDTTVPGWLTVGGGAVLTGVSVFLFIRGSGESSSNRSAFVIPTSDGAYAGFATRF